MSQLLRVIFIVLALGAAVLVWVEIKQDGSRRLPAAAEALADRQPASDEQQVETQTTYGSEKGVELIVTLPTQNSVIVSPLTVTGEAPGFWFFEATFPLVVVNWDGLIIGEGYAQAQDEWMTQELVPFVGTIEFYEPLAQEGRQAIVGGLILQRANPSGLAKNDDVVEFQIRFAE